MESQDEPAMRHFTVDDTGMQISRKIAIGWKNRWHNTTYRDPGRCSILYLPFDGVSLIAYRRICRPLYEL